MTVQFGNRFLCSFIVACGVTAGCGGPPPPPTASIPPPAVVSSAPGEPTFEIAGFAPLEDATMTGAIPYLGSEGGRPSETPCVTRHRKPLSWKTTNPDIIRSVEATVLPIKSAVQRWLIATFDEPTEEPLFAGISMEIDDLMVRHVSADQVRLDNEQTCFTADRDRLVPGDRVVTTLFGAAKLLLHSDAPIDRGVIQEMRNRIRQDKRNIRLRTIPTYPQAVDENNKPILDRGRRLHRAPDGELVLPRDVPLPAKRPIHEVELVFPEGLFFAYGHMHSSYWHRVQPQTACDINLIFDDIVPRVPECPGVSNIGYGVREGADPSAEVIVRVSADNTLAEQTLAWNTTTLIQNGGRYLSFVTPRPLDLGARLEVSIVVLNPSSEEEPLLPFKHRAR